MPHDEKMKISELRKMLKEHRKSSIAPVSKMAKHQVLAELDRYASTPSTMPSKAPVVVKEEKAVKVEKKMETAPGTSLPKPKKVKVAPMPLQEPIVAQKVEDKAVEPKKEVARAKLIKGSAEARAFMASIRMKKTKEKDVS